MNFEEIFHKHKDKVFSLCYRYLQQEQEAEDAVQDIFVKVFRKIESPKAMVLTVLAGISILLSLNFLSLQHKKTSIENDILNELGLIQKLSLYGSI